MPRISVSRYQQGDLDSLCGAYAIVHAILVATTNYRPGTIVRPPALPEIEEDGIRHIFAHLVLALAKTSLADPLLNGISARGLLRLLRAASNWLAQRHGYAISISRPYSGTRRVRRSSMIRLIREHLDRHGTTVIVGARPPWDHWTVVRGVGRTRLSIVDSGNMFYVPIGRGRSSHDSHAGLIEPNCVFLLTLKPARARKQDAQRAAPERL